LNIGIIGGEKIIFNILINFGAIKVVFITGISTHYEKQFNAINTFQSREVRIVIHRNSEGVQHYKLRVKPGVYNVELPQPQRG
jgi:hypothetical protein